MELCRKLLQWPANLSNSLSSIGKSKEPPYQAGKSKNLPIKYWQI